MSKVWMITGCSSGLGKGIAQAVLNQGDTAIITARHADALQDLIQSYPHQVYPVYLDLTDPQSIQEAAPMALQRFCAIDVLVNNAGHGYRATIEESEPDAIQEVFWANFFGPMELIRALLPSMRANRKGQIINISSIGGIRGALGNGYYSAAKGALELASETLAKEIEPFGIQVMIVEPGGFRTGFYGERLQETRHHLSDYDRFAAQYRKDQMPNRLPNGDPVKAGKLIVQTAQSERPPFRLLLGKDAYTQAKSTLENRLKEMENWKHISLQSDFEEKKGTCL